MQALMILVAIADLLFGAMYQEFTGRFNTGSLIFYALGVANFLFAVLVY